MGGVWMRGWLLLLPLDAIVDFFSMHGHFLRRRDSDADLVAFNAEHRDGNAIADHDAFARSSGEN